MASENKIKYTSKDYQSIFSDLVNAIPALTDKWKNYAEDDPGIVLLKEMAYVGDMLCYNMDYQVNEVFPQTATQRKNAAKSYALVGCKMHWYQSATCTAVIQLTRPDEVDVAKGLIVTLPKFTQLYTPEGTPYVIIGDEDARSIDLPAGSNVATKTVTLVQGTIARQMNIYPTNIPSTGRIYLNNITVDEDVQNDPDYPHMELCMYDGSTGQEISDEKWTKVGNLLTVKNEGRYYELNIDDNDLPYIQLCNNYPSYLTSNANYLGLTYIVSDGEDGAVGENVGFEFQGVSYTVIDGTSINILPYLKVLSNTVSDSGKNPQTVIDARDSLLKEAITLNVAITLNDYEVLCTTVDGIRACRAVDYTKDTGTSDVQNFSDLMIKENDKRLVVNLENIDGYAVAEGSVYMTITDRDNHTMNLHDVQFGEMWNVTDEDAQTRLGVSYIEYKSGKIELDLTGTNFNINERLSITVSFNKKFAQYSVILQLVMNDYGYISDSVRARLQTLLDNRTVVTIQNRSEMAKIRCVPYNIFIYGLEPYSPIDSTFQTRIQEVAYKALYDYYNSSDREFGENIKYTETAIAIQEADAKINLANILYPIRNFPLEEDEYPRLGPVCVNLHDDPNFIWMYDNLFYSGDNLSDNYDILRNKIIGENNYEVIMQNNNNPDGKVREQLILLSSIRISTENGFTLPEGVTEETLSVSWWCSRDDLVNVTSDNSAEWGKLYSSSIIQDTEIVLFPIIHKGNALLAITDPVKLVLAKGN